MRSTFEGVGCSRELWCDDRRSQHGAAHQRRTHGAARHAPVVGLATAGLSSVHTSVLDDPFAKRLFKTRLHLTSADVASTSIRICATVERWKGGVRVWESEWLLPGWHRRGR